MQPHFFSCAAILAASLVAGAAAAQTAGARLQDMPPEIRQEVEQVRKACTELMPSYAPADEMQGLMLVKLGDRPAIVVDNRHLCTDHVAGANCSNRGCDVAVWQQRTNGLWVQVLKEHLHARQFRLDRTKERLEAISLVIYAGHPWCNPRPGAQFTSGQSCRLTIRYVNGEWVPQRGK